MINETARAAVVEVMDLWAAKESTKKFFAEGESSLREAAHSDALDKGRMSLPHIGGIAMPRYGSISERAGWCAAMAAELLASPAYCESDNVFRIIELCDKAKRLSLNASQVSA